MPKIVQLDELTINQIAAGEVIERPASVVKELVENSIDAGATKIEVEVKRGGVDLIKIVDNGSGIEKEDLSIAFERHATSKIRSAYDIENVTSMGFRGEALASVAAVANVEMISKTETGNANKIIVEAGEVLEIKETAAPKGTTIIVRNLFFNTPVRYKFLKKDYTEVGYIEDVMRNLALVNKNIAFKLIKDGKTILQTNGDNNFISVVYSIYGQEIAENVIEVDETREGIRVYGVIGKPLIARSNRRNQTFFVNKRYIKDKVLYNAIDTAFKGMVPGGRFGFCILNVEVEPKTVDVNVHPAKLEVRFENEQLVYKAVYNAIKAGFTKDELVENITREKFDIRNNITSLKEEQSKYEYLQKKEVKSSDEHEKRNENIIDDLHSEHISKEEEILRAKNEELKKKFDMFNIGTREVSSNKIEDIINSYKKKFGNPEEVIKDFDNEFNVERIEVTEDKKEEKKPEIEKKENLPFGNDLFSDEENVTLEISDDIRKKLRERETLEMQKDQNTKSIRDFAQTLNYQKEYNQNEEKINEYTKRLDSHEILENLNKETNMNNENTFGINEELKEEVIDTDSEIASRSTNNFDEMYVKAFGTEILEKKIEKRELEKKIDATDNFKSINSQTESIFKGAKIPYRVIGVAFKTYIIVEVNQEVYMIDQHAAHERVLFEKVRKNYYEKGPTDIQMLLLPDVITLSYREYQLAKNNKEIFAKAGFEFEEFGINTIKLVGVPSMVEILNTKELFLDILDEIDGVSTSGRKEIEYKFLATVACKAAVKAGMTLSDSDIKSLLDEMFSIETAFTCPHGRPTTIKMSKYDLERKFSRK